MTKDNLVTAPVGTSLDDAERILARHRIEKLPVVDGQGRAQGSHHGQGHLQATRASQRQQGPARPFCGSAAAVGGAQDATRRARRLMTPVWTSWWWIRRTGHSEGVFGP